MFYTIWFTLCVYNMCYNRTESRLVVAAPALAAKGEDGLPPGALVAKPADALAAIRAARTLEGGAALQRRPWEMRVYIGRRGIAGDDRRCRRNDEGRDGGQDDAGADGERAGSGVLGSALPDYVRLMKMYP